jgi:hypothetical protein
MAGTSPAMTPELLRIVVVAFIDENLEFGAFEHGSLGDAIDLLLRRAGFGVDAEGSMITDVINPDAGPRPSWPDLFRPSTSCFN